MPLKRGKSKKIISSNIKELTKKPASSVRAKGIRTLAKRKNITSKQAKQRQAVAIALSSVRKKKK